jgi:uncharacterized membrane protein
MSTLVDHHELKQTLRQRKAGQGGNKHPVNRAHFDDRDFGQRVADQLSAGMGSWPFLIFQTVFMITWVIINAIWFLNRGFDPYPFILLNLALSLQATYAGPIVLLAGNRQSAKDRLTLEHAAVGAEKGGEAVNQILQEIRKNTKLTLEILEELERQ